ncbi:MAG: response regulator [Candidatus Hydrogenedentes bacterium]|nr:response regulator [Candidatus Hydrogenedentota bacterium]
MNAANRILIVDDESVIRELLSDILTDDGYPVESVASAPAALDIITQRDDFALLFTDIMMPDMDGIELIRRARKVRPTLIPIVMTGFATLETARAAVKEGAYDYVLKPFSLSEVKLAVSNALDRARLQSENTRLQELTEIFSISQSMATIRDEFELHEFVLESALRQVGAQRGSLMLATPDGQALEVVASRGLPREASAARVNVADSISGRVMKTQQPLLVTNIRSHETESLSRRLPHSSFVSVPLPGAMEHISFASAGKGPSQVLAVLNVCGKHNGANFSEADLKVLDVMAKHAAAAIENIRLVRLCESGHIATLRQLAELQEMREANGTGRASRVTRAAQAIARRLGLGAPDLAAIEIGAALYDLGKISLDVALLTKTGELTKDEWEAIRRHPIIGYDLARNAQFLPKAHLEIIRHHHERLDGSGYPDGLHGDQIPILARIMSVADAYVAMSSPRAYRNPLPAADIVGEIKKQRGIQFDVEASDALVHVIEHGELA